MKKKSNNTLYLGLIAAVIVGVMINQLYMGPWSAKDELVKVTIPPRTSTQEILSIFHNEGLIKSMAAMKFYFKISGADKRLNTGVFELNRSNSPVKNINSLSKSQSLIKITIPEGFTIKKIAPVLHSKGLIDSEEDFLTYTRTKAKSELSAQFPFLSEIPVTTIEGYLFPSTYYFAYGTSLKTIVTSMLRAFDQQIYRVFQVDAGKKGSLKARFSFHEVLTFASIVEKEARARDEMPNIAAVYNNRLKKRMRLEADPTVLYALGEPDTKRVLYRDLEVSSPYNTYRNFGLPPGPIASPGVQAMKAALAPSNSTALYFVADPKTGYHHFSQTYAQHLRRVKEMRRKR